MVRDLRLKRVGWCEVNVIKPPILKPGEKIGLVCPASRPPSPAVVKRSVWLLAQLGFHPVVGDNVLKTEGFFAGTDEERLSDLVQFFLDPDVKAICCISGGYGSLRLLDQIDYSMIQEHPKLIIGSDDNTSLLLAINKMTGLVTVHGPNLERMQSIEAMRRLKNALTKSQFETMLVDETKVERIDKKRPGVVQVSIFSYAPVQGQSVGRILAGNLTAMVSLMGTPYQPDFAKTILLLEDIDERVNTLDRWLTTLYIGGALKQTLAVGFGKFENCHSHGLLNSLSLEDIFGDRLVQMGKPCCFNFPFGQSSSSSFVPIGIQANIDTKLGKLHFLESAFA
jgi:muramoyltetrapeptide carboxypeptidase